jgi:hypothetical protein
MTTTAKTTKTIIITTMTTTTTMTCIFFQALLPISSADESQVGSYSSTQVNNHLNELNNTIQVRLG